MNGDYPTIAYLGPAGTYSELAALTYQGQGLAQLQPHHSIQGTLRAVAEGRVTQGVVPVENSIEGSVGLTLDMLWNLDGLTIQAAIELPITHALLGFSLSLTDIERVYSHPQALAQCQGWLEQYLPRADLIPLASTSQAVHSLVEDPKAAAIASPRAAQLHGVPILQAAIQDYPDNRTRFWVVGRAGLTMVGERLSLAFSPCRRGPGVLVESLKLFAERGINLTRIESRPSKKCLGEYVFFIDVQGDFSNPAMTMALQELALLTEELKVLGCYSLEV